MGDVFLAEDLETGYLVVIRTLAPNLALNADVLAAFEGDAAKLRSLNLPTIAAYEDIFFHRNSLHMVRPYLPGPPLDKFLAEHGPLPPAQWRQWALSLARTLAAAHVEGVVHGDLRPGNIYVVPKRALPALAAAHPHHGSPPPGAEEDTRPIAERYTPTRATQSSEDHPADTPGDFRLVITNFSSYRLLENRRLVTTSARLRVSSYTSPQRWQGQPTTMSDDIWNLGVLLFQMASGRLPFEGGNDADIMNRVLYQATPNLRGRVPRGPVAIIERLLEKDPWRRYRSLGAVISDLERGTVRWPGRRAGLMPRRRSPLLSWGVFLLFVLLLLAIPAGGGVALVTGYQPTPTPIRIAGVLVFSTPTPTPTPIILPFQPGGPPTATLTPSATWTPLVITNTPLPTFTPSDTPTATFTPSITPSPTVTPSATATATATATETPTLSPTPTLPPTATATPTATDTPTATATTTWTPSPTLSPTPTATPTSTPNATATANLEAFLTRAAIIAATQTALETRLAPTPTPDLAATSVALTPAAAILRQLHPARTASSALPQCFAGEQLVFFSDFTTLSGLPGTLPGGFLNEQIGRDAALHLTQTGTWAIPIPVGYARVRFDMLAPRAVTPPLTLSFVPAGTAANRIGWRLTWALGDAETNTGLLLEKVRGGQPETVSSLVSVPFDEWVTVDMGFQPLVEGRSVFQLNVYTAAGSRAALLVIDNDELAPFSALAINATIDSAPWLDNLQICARPGPWPPPVSSGS